MWPARERRVGTSSCAMNLSVDGPACGYKTSVVCKRRLHVETCGNAFAVAAHERLPKNFPQGFSVNSSRLSSNNDRKIDAGFGPVI